MVAAAVVWQHGVGTADESLIGTVLLLGPIAGVISIMANYVTMSEIAKGRSGAIDGIIG